MLAHAVDYDASHLWITGFALWITMLRICGFPTPSGSGASIRT